jgi:serine/threonine-protein kinase
MVMEYLHGRDLAQLVQDQGPLPIDQSVAFVLQACEAIAEAHALGIVHRDLKPSNLFLTHRADGSPCVKVLDFGISKTTGMAGSGPDLGMTRTTAIMGSPLYMSPEQMASARNVDARTDIWALGAILFELLTGQVPFAADTMPQLCAMVLQEPAPPLRGKLPMAPEGLEAAILKCLEKTPASRYANVAEFAHALLPYAPRWGQASAERISRILTAAGQMAPPTNTLPSSPSPATKGASTQSAWDGSTPAPRRRAPWVVLGLALVTVAAGAAFGLKALGTGETTTPSAGLAPEQPTLAPPVPSVVPVTEVTRDVPDAPVPAAPAPSAAPVPSAAVGAQVSVGSKTKPSAPRGTPRKSPVVEAPVEKPTATPTPPPKKPVSDLYSDRK